VTRICPRWSAVVMLALLSGCDETPERAAWRAHLAELQRERLLLATTALEDAGRVPALEAEWAELSAELQLVAVARRLDAGVAAFARPEGVTLTFSGSPAACLEVVRALEHARPLTRWWSLRLGPGSCQWQAREAPEVRAFTERLATPAPPWRAPPPHWRSFGVGALQAECAEVERDLARLRAELGPRARVPELEVLTGDARALLDLRADAGVPCDLVILERAVGHENDDLLEVRSDALVHPLEPLSDPRLAGLVVRQGDALEWRCPR
jgi:hypothetical protein